MISYKIMRQPETHATPQHIDIMYSACSERALCFNERNALPGDQTNKLVIRAPQSACAGAHECNRHGSHKDQHHCSLRLSTEHKI